jgi:1-acyl-sn-glycerol-3-phosphate acyltransferase
MRADPIKDFAVTILCWIWFIPGFFLFFSWRYLACALLAKDPEKGFQRLNSRFYRVLFALLRRAAPRHKWRIDEEVAAIRSAVIVCNHLSYLDPLLLIALFEQHRTIVKTRFFAMPVFGWIIKKSGYFPASSKGRLAGLTLRQMETMADFLAQGGNLFVFPEGTRARDGRIGRLNRGAMKIARLCRAPIYVLQLAHTDNLFAPGTFLYQTGVDNIISLRIIDHIAPDYQRHIPSAAGLEQRIMAAYARQT